MNKEQMRSDILQALVIATSALIIVVLILAFKYRSLEDRFNKQEIPEIKVKIIYSEPLHIEPSEDELKISINGEEEQGE